MQAALAARTTPDRGRYYPHTFAEIEAVIQQVRAKVAGESVADGVGNTYQRGTGKNRTACRHCGAFIRSESKRCSHCAGKQ